MNQVDKLYIAATGVMTSIGFNTQMTAAAVNAGISAYTASDYFNKKDQPMTAAFVPDDALPELSEALQGLHLKADEKRMIGLSQLALNQIETSLPKDQQVPLFLAGPENIPARPSPITSKIIQYIQVQSGLPIDVETSRYMASGRAGVVNAIDLAFKYLTATDAPCVLVGGVDSYNNTGLISFLDSEDRILAQNITDGFAIGEAAGFILLARNPHKSFFPVAVSQPGLSQEEGHLYSDAPYKGEGLSKAAAQALHYSGLFKVEQIYSSMNGERFFVKELGVLSMRNAQHLQEGYQVHHPADCYGDIGAATGAVLLALSAMDLLNKDNGTKHMLCCSSDMAERGVVCVSKLG